MEERTSSGKEEDLGILISHISKRPQMYIGSSALVIVAAFIQGFAYSSNDVFDEEIREFNRWLAARLNFPGNWAWWCGLEQSFPSDDEALSMLPKLFDEFRQSQKEKRV